MGFSDGKPIETTIPPKVNSSAWGVQEEDAINKEEMPQLAVLQSEIAAQEAAANYATWEAQKQDRAAAAAEAALLQSNAAVTVDPTLLPGVDEAATCPCKKSVTDEEKAAHAWCQTNNPIQNVAGKNAGALSAALGKSIAAFSVFSDPTSPLVAKLGVMGVDTGKINNMAGNLVSMQNSVNLFKAEADRLSDPKNLMSMVGQMDLYGKIGCAFGIEGLDISGAASIVTEDGITRIAAMAKVHADIDKMIGNPADLGAADDIAQGIADGIDSISGAINEGIGAMNDLTNKATDLMTEAMLKISEFTQINFLINLVGDGTDPCNKIQAKLSGNLLSPEFKEYAQRAYDSKHAPTDAGFR